MIERKDYYQCLGVAYNAGEDDIRKAFHRLALVYHPDRNPNNIQAEDKFKEINEAYQVLSDGKKRARYDKLSGLYPRPHSSNSPADGFSDFASTEFGRWATSGTVRPRARHTTTPKTPRPRSTAELHEFVIRELVNMHTIEAITYELCENYGMKWQDAKSLVDDIHIREAKLIKRGQTPWLVPVTLSMFIGGSISTFLGLTIIIVMTATTFRSIGSFSSFFLLNIPVLMTYFPTLLGYAWLLIVTGIGLVIGSLRSMQDVWATTSEYLQQRKQERR